MVSTEDIIIERLLTFSKTQSDECLREILVVLNKLSHKLNYELLQKEIDRRRLGKEWEILKKIVFISKWNY